MGTKIVNYMFLGLLESGVGVKPLKVEQSFKISTLRYLVLKLGAQLHSVYISHCQIVKCMGQRFQLQGRDQCA